MNTATTIFASAQSTPHPLRAVDESPLESSNEGDKKAKRRRLLQKKSRDGWIAKAWMKLKPGMSALVTGGANGIGKAIGMALAQNGIFVTIVDISEEKGNDTTSLIEKENLKANSDLKFPSAMFIKCDVTNTKDLSSAFQKHLETYGGLDICINSAGIGGTVQSFDKDETDGSATWKRTIDVNLVAVIDCTRVAIQTMRGAKNSGVIVNLGSAAGLYPFPPESIYSASKGGVVLFTRSLAPLALEGIRVNVLCPEYVDTDIIPDELKEEVAAVGGFLHMDMILKGVFELITNSVKAGACLWITNRRGMEYWPTPEEQKKYMLPTEKEEYAYE